MTDLHRGVPGPQYVSLGTVGKAHGVRGGFFIAGRTQPLEFAAKGMRILLKPCAGGAILECTVSSAYASGGRSVLALKELADRSAIERLRGAGVYALREQIEVDDAAEYLWADIVGRQVVDRAGCEVGVVDVVNNFGASDIVYIKSVTGLSLGVPFVQEYFEMDFDTAGGDLRLAVSKDIFEGCWE